MAPKHKIRVEPVKFTEDELKAPKKLPHSVSFDCRACGHWQTYSGEHVQNRLPGAVASFNHRCSYCGALRLYSVHV